jgi:hypothetical protein
VRRGLAILGLLALALIALIAVARFGAVEPRSAAPDPSTPIHLADGRVLPLSEVLLAGARHEAPSTETELQRASAKDPPKTRDEQLLELAKQALSEGRDDEALALFLSVDVSAISARETRYIGWDVLTKRMGEPRRGVAYVESALRREPLDGNSWQDLARVYAHSVGLALD